MRSLFWTVFTIFWAGALIILAGVIFLTDPFHADSNDWLESHYSVEEISEQAINEYETKSVASLNEFVTTLRKKKQVNLWLINSKGQTLQQAIPSHIAQQINSFPQIINPNENTAGPFYIETVNSKSTRGQSYRLILTYNEKNKPGYAPPHLIKRYIFVLIAILIGSLLIAWTLTRPIRKLQLTTKEFASGNLQARAPEMIIQRRDSIGDLGREFNHMAQQVDNLLSSQIRLLRDVSHELRTPLARIQVALALAEQRSTGGESQHKRIETELSKLDMLISQILKLSRLEADADKLILTTFKLDELLRTLITDVEFEFNEQNKTIKLISADNITIAADYHALSSALENVIRNAMRYTAESSEVEVSIHSSNKQLEIKVKDQGAGVNENELDEIFTPFYRTSEARETASGGQGIGLAITKHIIRQHRGEITAENNEPQGLIMQIKLPYFSEAAET